MECSCRFSGRVNVMEIGIFGVLSKTFAGKLFARNAAFRGMQGNVLTGLFKQIVLLK